MVSLASLLIQETKTAIYETAIRIAELLDLPVSSWQPGDPTRSLFHLESELLAKLEEVVVGFISAGFLDYATGDWLEILAKQVFNVDVPAATFASTDLVLTNAGGGVYIIEAGDVIFKSTLSDKTYHNTTGGTLNGLGTLTVSVEADEAGSDSSAGAGEIDDLVTTLLGVTCTNPTAAIGNDKQDEATTRQQCRNKLSSLSPNGPKGIYSYVALSPDLTGTTAVTRVREYPDSDTGDVLIYLAGPSGAVAAPDVALVEAAIATYATPLCITPTVLSATPVTQAVTYELWLYKSVNKTAAEVKADVLAALESMFKSRPIGGDIVTPGVNGKLYTSEIAATIKNVYSQAFRVSLSVPASDLSLANSEVAALGAVTGSINFVSDP